MTSAKLKLHWFLRLADVGSVSRPKSSTFEPLGSKHGGLETAATSLDWSFFSRMRQRSGGGTDLKLHRAVTGVGWALLPVGVLDGQECPSYNRHGAIDVVVRDNQSSFLNAPARGDRGFSVPDRSKLQYTIVAAIGHQQIARGWIEGQAVGVVQELSLPGPPQEPST